MSTQFYIGCPECKTYVEFMVRYAGCTRFTTKGMRNTDDVGAQFVEEHHEHSAGLVVFDEHAERGLGLALKPFDGWTKIANEDYPPDGAPALAGGVLATTHMTDAMMHLLPEPMLLASQVIASNPCAECKGARCAWCSFTGEAQ